jgi:hypothetical protein
MMELTCRDCRRLVTPDDAFIRSVNLVTTAWCRQCWMAKHEHLLLPEQRTAPTARRRRRWLLLR